MYDYFPHLLKFLGFIVIDSWTGILYQHYQVSCKTGERIVISYRRGLDTVSASILYGSEWVSIFQAYPLDIFVLFYADRAEISKERRIRFLYGG